jgi:coenzyme F420-reducing hydrogenase beta subunit
MKFDSYGQFKPSPNSDWFKKPPEIFSRICPFSPVSKNEDELSDCFFPDADGKHLSIGRYKTNFIGYVKEQDFRSQGSSGGMVSWVASELIKRNLVDGVAHVIPAKQNENKEKFFYYTLSRSEREVREGSKSRYYPVEMSEILKTILEKPGRYAIIAVPCMIKAVQLLRIENPIFKERILFTLGLFCGHMKSSRFFESIAWQVNVPIREIIQFDFRFKSPELPSNLYHAKIKRIDGQDIKKNWWNLVDGDWGAGFFMNSACNFCDDVVAETADISFGDAWIEPYSSDGRGTNVVVVRSSFFEKFLLESIKEDRLSLIEVSPDIVEKTQSSGFRQRRDGLAYRLSWLFIGIKPLKRFSSSAKLSRRSKLIFLTRYLISKWSHRVFWLARRMNLPFIYFFWARTVSAFYYSIVYQKGNLKLMRKRFIELKNSL